MDTFTRKSYADYLYRQFNDAAISFGKNGVDVSGHCRHYYGDETFWRLRFQSGLQIQWADSMLYHDVCVKNSHNAEPWLVSKFYISGHHHVRCPGIPGVSSAYDETAGHSYMFSLPDIQEDEIYLSDQQLQRLWISIRPSVFRELVSDIGLLPTSLKKLLNPFGLTRFHQSLGRMTPAMNTVVQQMIQCPYQTPTKRLYLESKTLELIALQIEQWLANEQALSSPSKLKASDLERVYHAAEILQQELRNPPSLIALARKVGLNDYKLKVGFRQAMGTTVFGYVRSLRLERARQLLESGDISVTHAASAVGYASQGHFAAAFRKKFGMNPRSLRCN
ncbi:MAG: AraC family transcriptional regulator [Cyanobacteria bacterium P01_E01_bin.6]